MSSTIFSVLGVIVGVAALAALAVWLVRKGNARYAQLWAPLAPLVNGTAKSSTLTGTYNGGPMRARVRSDNGESPTYYYELLITPGARGKDWKASYGGEKLLGLGTKTWHITTKDEQLKQRLTDAGVLALLESWTTRPKISYSARSGQLEYSEAVRDAYTIPDADTFGRQLQLLGQLAQLNDQVNVI